MTSSRGEPSTTHSSFTTISTRWPFKRPGNEGGRKFGQSRSMRHRSAAAVSFASRRAAHDAASRWHARSDTPSRHFMALRSVYSPVR
jgi:hypothetical protein